MSVQFQSSASESRQPSHPDPVKKQFAQAQRMGDTELLLWVTGQNEALEPIRIETVICLLKRYASLPEKTAVVIALVTAVENKVRVAVERKRRRLPAWLPVREASNEVCSRLWTQVFKHKAPWAEVCVWKVVSHLLADVIRERKRQPFGSMDTDSGARSSALSLFAKEAPLEVTVYLRQRLMRLKPNQRRAVLLRHGYGHTLRQAGAILHKTPRSVANLVNAAKRKLQLDN